MLREAYGLWLRKLPFALTIFGLISVVVTLGIKWLRQGLHAMQEHFIKVSLDSLIPTAIVMAIALFYYLLYVVPERIYSDAANIEISLAARPIPHRPVTDVYTLPNVIPPKPLITPLAEDPPRFKVSIQIRQPVSMGEQALMLLQLENVSDTPTSGLEYQFAMLPSSTTWGPHPVFSDSMSTIIEKNSPKQFHNFFHVGIVGEKDIRIWLKHRSLRNPRKELTDEFYYESAGSKNPNAITRIEESKDLHETKAYFDKYVPKPKD